MNTRSVPLSVRLAATFTAEPLQGVLDTWLREFGFAPDSQFAPFNQVLQQLLDPGSLLATHQGGVNVILVRACDLSADSPARARSAAREVGAALSEASTRDGCQTLVVVCPAASGPEVESTFLADLREQLRGVAGVDLIAISEWMQAYPVAQPFDAEAEAAACVPFSEPMFAAMATIVARRLLALRRKPYKVIAVDCDHTLWTGVCGEAGPRGVVVDGARRAFHEFLMARRAEGYLLCLVSKNHSEDVEAVFRENPGMVIPRDAFVAGMINWDPKSTNLRRLAERLNLGLDSFVFLDDNPAEVAEVEANVPAVLALRIPEQAEELPGFVRHLWVLDRPQRSDEDARRADFYHDEARRLDLRERAPSFESFIEGLELKMEIVPVTDADIARASQLTQRTNQFNACPQPRDEAALMAACRGMRAQLVHVSDRFGDYGAVGLMCTREDSGRLWAETFLLSCRALGKGVEQRMLRYLGELARELNLSELAIWFNDTGRNQPVLEFLESVPGSWESGVRVIPVEAAVDCDLLPVVARSSRGADEINTPLADPALVARIANELREVPAIADWASEPVRPRPDIGERMVAPQGEIEESIASIWAAVLGLEEVGRADRFVDLGGTSLQLVRVHARMQREFGVHFDLVRMFENPTVAAQADLVSKPDTTTVSAESEPRREPKAGDALAIVGMSLRLPDASSPEELWKNLLEGRNSITHFDPGEADVPVPENDPNFVCARGLLEPEVYEGIDGGLFGILPREAEMIDPQQRVFLELCWEALERGGYVPDDAEKDGGRVGIYAGCYYDTYLPHHILSDPEYHRRHLAEAQVGALSVEFGNDKDHLATRVAFKLNLKGPSLTVQTACSSSLVAVAHAAMALRTGQCDMALAGGVTVTVPQKRGYHHEEGGMLSKDGRCRPFDAESSGTVFSNGAGCVLLKRLDDAVRDGDHIHAVIRGFGMNNDGGVKHSYAAPSVEGQADAIRRAHLDAGVDARSISYVEAHGTATPLGDPIEVSGLTQAFRASTEEAGFCALGSLKSNLGHLDTAAGVCGLIKTAMSLEYRELPAVLHFEKPNPRIDFASSPFFVNDKLRPWTADGDQPLRAGVSSFGVGGTNVHVVLEEAPRDVTPTAEVKGERVWVLSGRNEEAVDQLVARLAKFAHQADRLDFAAAARTMALGRKAMGRRAAVVASDWTSLAAALEKGRLQTVEAAGVSPEQVWMFPGQGAQHPGMTADLYEFIDDYRHDVDFCAEFLKPLLGEDLRDVLFAEDGGDAAEKLKHTVLAQPAIFVVEWALARQWARWGLRPEVMVGHSVGEFTAACLAGVFSVEDGLRILAERGRLMGEVAKGSMLSVRLSADELRALLPETLDLAAVNGPELCVVAGPDDEVASFAAKLEAEGVNVRPLHTSHAFHSRMMDEVVDRFRAVIEGIKLHPPRMRILSTVSGRDLEDKQATDPGYWAAHLRETVNFHAAIDAVAAEQEGRVFLEVGPGQTLTTLARQTAGRRALACLSTCEHPASGEPDGRRMRQSLGDLWARGVDVDWSLVHHDAPARRVPLPTYPFQRRRAWLECQLLDRPIPESKPAVSASAEAPAESEAVESAPQASGVMARIGEVLEGLSGIPADEMEPRATFLELGFDSLLLTQAARELQKAFGVPIAFRDLMQTFPTLADLAAHLEQHGASAGPAESPKPARAPASQPTAEDGQESSGVSGPRTRIDRQAVGDELSTTQRDYLAAFTRRYCEKTSGSKKRTQEYRQWHADPRTVNGFNRLWKEMVYQVVATRMKGCRMWDVDGNEYIDMVNGFGPNFLGHSPDFVTEAIQEQLSTGLEIGPQCEAAMETSKLFCEVTGNERVCFLNTGSEAVQAAMRISRTVTGRDKILVFDKDYHGNFDPVLVRSVGKGARRRTLPLAPGIPASAVEDVIVVPWGKPEALDMIREVAGELAAVLVEPVQSRQPELIPIDFVREVKKISEEEGFLLVFDEVITGIRQGPRGAQELYGIEADLATYGKVFGGGALPIGIVGGKAKYMDTFDGGHWQFGDDSFPEKEVTFFAGTFVRLPLAMAACRAVLNHVKSQPREYWDDIGRRADRLATTVDRMFRDQGIDVRMVNFNSQMYLRIGDDAKYGNLIYYHLRSKGVFAMEGLPFYLTAAHTDADVDFVINAFRETIDEMQAGGFLPTPEILEVESVSADARGPFPMTEPMAEIWLASLLGKEANLAFNEMLQLRLTGSVDEASLLASIQDLVDRHDALRMRVPQGREAVFVIDRDQDACVIEKDLRGEPDPEAALVACGVEQRETEFELATGPLLRVVVARVADDETVLQFAAHHLAADGWSFEVMIRDFAACYEARVAGRKPTLTPAPSIVDRALREQAQPSGGETSMAWWADRFKDGAPEVELPLRKSYGATPSYTSATCEVTLDEGCLGRLRGLAKSCGGTLNSTLLAGFQVLLHKLSGQRDFVMTFPTAGQMQSGEAELVGHCVNFLPLLAAVDADGSFKDHVKRSSSEQLDALEHGDLTYGSLLRTLKIGRDEGRRPLMEVIFNFEPSGDPGNFGGLRARVETVAARYSNSTIFLNLMQLPDGLLLSSTYNRELIDEGTMRHWLDAFRVLLETAAEDASASIASLPMLDDVAHRELVEWGAAPACEAEGSIIDAFSKVVASNPDAVALTHGTASCRYGELAATASSIAAALIDVGLRPGNPVGIVLPRSFDSIASLLGVLHAGGCYVPVDPAFPEQRQLEILRDAGVKAVIGTQDLPGFQRIDPRSVPQSSVPAVARTPEDPAYVMYTSGSTGRPKGVVVPQRGVLRLVGGEDYAHFGRDEVLLHASTPAFDASTFEIFGALLHGARLVLLDEDENSLAGIASTIRRESVTTLWLTAGLFELMVDEHLEDLRGVRQLLAGGDVLSVPHVRRALDGLPETALINGYGPTENTTFTCCHRIARADLERGSIPIGRPISGTSIRIVDESGEDVPVGMPGELICGGLGLALGYLGQPELTDKRFVDHPAGKFYRTGDRCRWAADGVVEFLGRIDQQVKVRGFRIEPAEIEGVLTGHPSVSQAKVAVRGDGAADKRLLAWFCREPGTRLELDELTARVDSQLPRFMRPEHLIEVDSMPLNANGKVVVDQLPEPHVKVDPVLSESPEEGTEKGLASIWCELLGLNQVGRDDDFFTLGGNSLAGLRMFARIQREFGVSLPLATLLRARTLRALAVAVDSGGAIHDAVSVRGHLAEVQPEGAPPPLCAIHGGDGGILFYRQLAERLPKTRPFIAIESPELGHSEEIRVGSIEETAAAYIEILRGHQPEGPYLLAGYSYGGVVAYEMARQLSEAGEEVPFVGLFDTTNPAADVRPYALGERVSVYWNASQNLSLGERILKLAGRFKDGVETHMRVKAEVADAQREGAAEAHTERRAVQLREAHEAAMDAYVPGSFRGTLHLFRADAVNDKFEIPDDYGWGDCVDDLVVIEVPGEHLTLFESGHVGPLADHVSKALGDAVDGADRTTPDSDSIRP